METAPFQQLRPWLRYLADTDRLLVTHPGVKLVHGVAAIAKHLQHTAAVLFPEPDGHDIPVISNLLCKRSWFAEALGVTQSELLERYRTAADNPLPFKVIEDAPAQEVTHKEVDLCKLLPIPTHNEHDNGPYITAALLISRNPETGAQNVAIHRCQISGPNRIGLLLLPRHTLAFQRIAEDAGNALEIALVIGVDPLTLLASQAIAPLGQDELEIAGALHGSPLEVVKCMTNQVHVPAHSEIVLEGRLLPELREPEGPFGEFPQYYGRREKQHVIEIDLVTHRRNPIFHTILGGGMEHLLLGAVPREASMLALLKRSFPSIRDVHLSEGGVCRYNLVVQIDKRSEGEAKNVIMGAFGGHYDIKQVTVVDTDVDIHNPSDVQWAVSTRFQADKDLVVISGAQCSKLDPSTDEGVGAKMGLDATKPLSADPFAFTRIRVPGEEDVDPQAIVNPDSADVLRELLD